MKSGLELFGKFINDRIFEDIKSWEKNPMLFKLFFAIQSANESQRFLDFITEAMIARHLIKLGWEPEYEYLTCKGKQADFKVSDGTNTFFLHIKRLNLDKKTQKETNIQKRFKSLEQINKPYFVKIELSCEITDLQTQKFVKVASNFIKGEVKVRDTKKIFDNNNMPLGECTIHSVQNNKEHVSLIPIGNVRFVDDRKRIYDKFLSAYKQFIPNGLNIILVALLWSDQIEDFESALLGSTYEDHTVTPITRGRNNDGFWSNDKHSASQVAGWFKFDFKNDNIIFRIWYRQNYQVPIFLKEVFKQE